MKIINWLKGVINKMLRKEDIQKAIKLTPVVSSEMRESIDLWLSMYQGHSPWLSKTVTTIGLPALIAGEKARMATLESEIKVTGESERAEFLSKTFKQVESSIRPKLEYGIALGSLVIKPYVTMGPNGKYRIKFEYVKACDFYPLSFTSDGELSSGAFIGKIITADYVYTKVEIHTLHQDKVTVESKAFAAKTTQLTNSYSVGSILGDEINLSSVPEWSSITPYVEILGVDTLLFAYFKNPEANIVDITSPLGISGYARAVNLIRDADKLYSNLLWEFKGSQLAIDVDRTAMDIRYTSDGKEIREELPELENRLFRRNLALGDENSYNIFSPAIRDASILNGLNSVLMHIEDATSLSRGTISTVSTTEARTATELKILKQRAFSANEEIQGELQRVYEKLFEVMDIYCDLYNIVPSGDYEVSYKWDDSILVDKGSEKQSDLLDVNSGLMSKFEYRIKWFGETEKQALESLSRIHQEQQEALELESSVSIETEEQKEQDTLQRANESNEVTTSTE